MANKRRQYATSRPHTEYPAQQLHCKHTTFACSLSKAREIKMQAEQSSSKTRTKLQDIVAHTGKTNCVSIGTSGSLLVTGGDDSLVNVWAIGRPGVVYSLQGHTAPVTSVCYDKKEEMVLAGSQSATVKLYDLQSAKQLRTITGHRSQISALDFHPVGNWFASGSLDTNWKLWDKRQRNCTATFKGHNDSISHLYFSPPGKWVVTASADGIVKVLRTHTASCCCLQNIINFRLFCSCGTSLQASPLQSCHMHSS